MSLFEPGILDKVVEQDVFVNRGHLSAQHTTSRLLAVPLTEEQQRQNQLRRAQMDLRSLESLELGKRLARGQKAHARVSSAATHIRRRLRQNPAISGACDQHDGPLTHEALWLDDARLPLELTPQPEHKCGICLGIKSHPVVGCVASVFDATFMRKGVRGGGRTGAPPPTMYTHEPYMAEVLSASADGRRAAATSATVHPQPEVPSHFQEDWATNAALEAADFSYTMGNTTLEVEEQNPEAAAETLASVKRKRDNSAYPMKAWMEHRDEYLDEMLRPEGRGHPDSHRACLSCGIADPTFRCAQQLCHGEGMFCSACIMQSHACLPTHWIEEWNGEYFERRALCDLGLVMQLGHPPGFACPTSTPGHKDFVVIDLTGVHTVRVHFCECDTRILHRQQLMRLCWWPATAKNPKTCATFAVVRLFQLLNCLGKVSAHDFLRSLELLTNNDGLTPPPNRRRAFRHIARQYRMTLMMKRAGRGHAESGVRGTAQGELALRCRACPQDGRNVPDGWADINWDEMPEDLRYKYFTFLAQDCNFRLINCNVSTVANDPIIDDGLGYFVNHAKYSEFLRRHVSEEEISSCSGFQAMFLANKKRVKGLRTTGVSGVTCAGHNMWRPNGIGDLQKGERYCNMDFILFSALLNTLLFYLILSYDIACQYGKNFWTQMRGLPEEFHLDLRPERLWFKVPNFHLPPHKPKCHSPFSFHWMWGQDGPTARQWNKTGNLPMRLRH
ncbi:hypothetical protein B0H13DRAFT_1899409 [Mycena leptocephala]|nr:hypothetical protein B0H13DRAFT_1899409 [Mycena leptocephala]